MRGPEEMTVREVDAYTRASEGQRHYRIRMENQGLKKFIQKLLEEGLTEKNRKAAEAIVTAKGG